MEFLEQVEDDLRLPFDDGIADRLKLVLHAERAHLVAERLQGRDDVVLGLPDVDLLLGVALGGVGWHQVRMQEDQNAHGLHRANHFRRPVP